MDNHLTIASKVHKPRLVKKCLFVYLTNPNVNNEKFKRKWKLLSHVLIQSRNHQLMIVKGNNIIL